MNKLMKALVPYILIAATVLFAYLGVDGIHVRNTYTAATADITGITSEYDFTAEKDIFHVMVRYTVDGAEYETELGSYTSGMRVGQEIKIMYDPSSPDRIVEAGYLGVVLCFGFSVLALFSAAAVFRKNALEKVES